MNARIENLIGQLDFDKIHDYMKITNWTYGLEDKVPSISTLQNTARELLEHLMESDTPDTGYSTGGFHATKWTYNGLAHYEIVFAIEDAYEGH